MDDLADYFAANVFHAGVLEQSARFVEGLSQKLGRTLEFPHYNRVKTGTAIAITPARRRRIEQIYPRDFALYEWVRARG